MSFYVFNITVHGLMEYVFVEYVYTHSCRDVARLYNVAWIACHQNKKRSIETFHPDLAHRCIHESTSLPWFHVKRSPFLA